MKDQISSIKQSHRLVELGVPEEKASMLYLNETKLPFFREEIDLVDLVERGHEYCPAFTIPDIDNILPVEVSQNSFYYRLTIDVLSGPSGKMWRYSYKCSHVRGPKPAKDNLINTLNESRIEAAINIVSNLLIEGYKLDI